MPDLLPPAHDEDPDLRLVPLAFERLETAARPREAQEWRSERKWERGCPVVADGFKDEGSRSTLYEHERVTGGTYMVTMQNAVLNWADNIIKDGTLHTRFRGNTATYALGIAKQAADHGWRVPTGLHPYGEGVAIDARKLRPHVILREPVLLATPDEPGNWGLFLLQSVPAAIRFVRDRKRYGKFMCHAPAGNRRDLLRLVGVRDEDFVNHDVSLTYGLQEVRLFQNWFRDLVVSPEDRVLLLSLAENVKWDHKIRKAPKLFLSRRMRTGEQSAYRVLRNELKLRHALEDVGFESIETEYMGPIDQVRAMAGAEVIVGLGGAGMFNVVFCPAETRVLDIESTSRFTNAHTNIFASCGLTYGVHIGQEIPDASRTDHHDWEVDVQQVLRSLDVLMNYKTAPRSSVVCRVDRMDGGRISGWAHNPAEPGTPLKLAAFVDGTRTNVWVDKTEVEHVTCSVKRPDVLAAKVGPEACGYNFLLPKLALDGAHHVFELRTLEGAHVKLTFADGDYDQRMFGHLWRPRILSSVEYLDGGVIRGWVLSAEFETDRFVGGQRVVLAWNGATLGTTVADKLLSEGYDDRAVGMNCAFSFELPSWLLLESKPLLRVFVEPQHAELEGSPLKPVVPGDEQRQAALGLYEELERLQEEVLASSVLVRGVALARYPRAAFARWDAEVSALLARRIPSLLHGIAQSADANRLSIFVNVQDADAVKLGSTLDSILAQTAPGSGVCLMAAPGRATRQVVNDAAKQYTQLGCQVLDRRPGTMDWAELAMLPPASGQGWCMFLESGDTLRPNAWAILQAAAEPTSSLLYFDDVDVDGNPRLKPGWNRTMLQRGDIVGRSVAVRAAVVARIPQKADEKGAYPVARLLASLDDRTIRHIPAVLATVIVEGRKQAIEARSKDYPMVKEAVEQIALVRTPSISILFVDEWHPGEFRRCVDLLASQIDYPAFEFVVCCSELHFTEIGKQPLAFRDGIRSRLVCMDGLLDVTMRLSKCLSEIETEFVVLISGHIIRPEPQWLRGLLRECLDVPTVGAVGGKNLQSDGTLRDAGFIKTDDGRFAPVGEGLAARAPGYLERLTRVQEVSALAGPAILFRRAALLRVVHLGSAHRSIATMLPEICLALPATGQNVIWAPDAVATCIELSEPEVLETTRSSYTSRRLRSSAADPFYNPNFAVEQPLFSQLEKPADAVDRLMRLLEKPQGPDR